MRNPSRNICGRANLIRTWPTSITAWRKPTCAWVKRTRPRRNLRCTRGSAQSIFPISTDSERKSGNSFTRRSRVPGPSRKLKQETLGENEVSPSERRQLLDAETQDPGWKSLYTVGGIAALIMVVFPLAEVAIGFL